VIDYLRDRRTVDERVAVDLKNTGRGFNIEKKLTRSRCCRALCLKTKDFALLKGGSYLQYLAPLIFSFVDINNGLFFRPIKL